MGSRPLRAGVRRLALAVLPMLLLAAGPSRALPAFAVQTGQPCQMCHVGGFGPQLTPYGRNFKIHGFTQRSTAFNLPLSTMLVASYVRTTKDQPPPPHYGANDNWTVDEASIFLAGGLGAHLGAFAQATYGGVARTYSWDNLDVRATTSVTFAGRDVALGLSLNNNPTLSDPWNTLPAWGFPYTDSGLAPAPATAPLLDGALGQNALGITAYAWISNALYLEAGGYHSPGANALRRLGADPTDPGDIRGLAPYGRIAYQASLAGGTAQIGAFGMRAAIHPGRDRSTGLVDRYSDLGVDASFYRALANGDVVSVNARYLRERQSLRATCALAEAGDGCARARLRELQADASYYWRDWIGATAQVFDLSGSANPFLYPDNRTFRPDSAGLRLQIDATPFGGRPQPVRRLNLRVGMQYTIYARFEGASHDFDGAGGKASDNNTLRVFTWLAF